MLSEFGSHGQQRGSWYRDLGTLVAELPRIKALVSFDSNPAGCDTRVTGSADNWVGFAAIAANQYFNPPPPAR
jgi:hypothetical protein